MVPVDAAGLYQFARTRSFFADSAVTFPTECLSPNRVIISIEMRASQGPVGTRSGVEWMRGPCAQYCSNKKNDKIQKLIHRIERRHSRLLAGLTLVLSVALFHPAGVAPPLTLCHTTIPHLR